VTYAEIFLWLEKEKQKYQVKLDHLLTDNDIKRSHYSVKSATIAVEMMLDFLQDFELQLKIKESQSDEHSDDKRKTIANRGTVGWSGPAIAKRHNDPQASDNAVYIGSGKKG